jgi:hypothetical protein
MLFLIDIILAVYLYLPDAYLCSFEFVLLKL